MNHDDIPEVVGGYRVGRCVGPGRYLGHALAPAVVELVFLEQLGRDEQHAVHRVAQDYASVSSGDRVAILEHAAVRVEPPRLTTPPALAESWRQMAAMATTEPSPDDDETARDQGVISRVSRSLRRARRGPLMLAAFAGVSLVIVVLLVVPSGSAPASPSVAEEKPTAVATLDNHWVDSAGSPTPVAKDSLVAEPLTSLGDMVLVRLPASSSTDSGEIAVLERTGESWSVRNVYPDAPAQQ